MTQHWDRRFQQENMCWITYEQVLEACNGEAFTMKLSGEEADEIIAAVNAGIDSHLEACNMPSRGDSYEWTRKQLTPRVSSTKLSCVVSPESLCVLLRRLFEADPCSSNGSSILYCLGFNDAGELVGREALGLE